MTEPDAFDEPPTSAKVQKKVLGKLAELLDRQGITSEDIGQIHRISTWQGMIKQPVPCENCHSTGKVYNDLTDDGDEITCPECSGAKRTFEPKTVDMVGIQLSPAWETGPAWPVVQPAKPCVVKHTRKAAPATDSKVTALLPDPQFGYMRMDDGELVPMHDEQAIACTLEVLAAIKPNRVIWMGDTLDFAEWSSKFMVLPEFTLTTQESVDRAHRFLAESLAAAGPQVKEADLLEGNHDNRMANAIAKNAMAALRLRRANTPEDWPVLSVPNLLRLDELGITYVDGYPAGRIKIAEAYPGQAPLFALHGEKLDVAKQARAERVSTVQGHAHHVALHSVTYYDDGGRLDVEAWSLGCLCKTDGAVPSTKGGTDVRGRYVERQESWQHAIGVLTETATGWWMEPIRIRDGRAVWHGKEYTA